MIRFCKSPLPYLTCFTLFFSAVYADSSTTMNASLLERPRALPPSLYGHAGDPTILVSAAYTYWTAREDGLNLAYSSLSTNPATSGSTYFPSTGAFSGFKVALAAILPHDAWELSGEFTYFVATRGLTTQTLPIGTTSLYTSDTLTSLSSQWNNWLYRADLDLRYTFFIGNYLSLRTLGGLASTFGDQSLTMNQRPFNGGASGSINETQWSWGIGPHVGLESDFAFYGTSHNQFSFFFDGGFALLLSQFETTLQYINVSTTTLSNATTLYSDIPLLETTFGIRWHSFIDGRDAASFLVELGWEEQILLGYNYMSFMNAIASPGNYWMYGLTLRAQIGF